VLEDGWTLRQADEASGFFGSGPPELDACLLEVLPPPVFPGERGNYVVNGG